MTYRLDRLLDLVGTFRLCRPKLFVNNRRRDDGDRDQISGVMSDGMSVFKAFCEGNVVSEGSIVQLVVRRC